MYRILTLTVGLCVSVMAQADAYGVFEMPGQTRTEVYYQDDDHIRINAGQDGYMLVSGGKVYSVMNQGGRKVAVNMDEMGRAMAQFSQGNNRSGDSSAENVEIRKTGKTETVSGYEGHVHEVSINGRTLEVVLSDHPRVVAATQGFLKAMVRVGQMLDPEDSGSTRKMLKDLDETGYGGILRQKEGLTLIEAKEVDKPDSFYQLPSDVDMMSMPNR
ncbi:hypothetical protein DES49_2133 [Halospina denitrificans]|uniref:DUF4412 domain-containing protein n=1 Tax=Halospina denitrificans TaxID=332522 RepID=A0A4R7JSN7_9GAMM|nr:hypothetical protein [Halospina denitrificans]TDT40367.1 hypothetical protein DES49_2133 [Halospina denitrificans]